MLIDPTVPATSEAPLQHACRGRHQVGHHQLLQEEPRRQAHELGWEGCQAGDGDGMSGERRAELCGAFKQQRLPWEVITAVSLGDIFLVSGLEFGDSLYQPLAEYGGVVV